MDAMPSIRCLLTLRCMQQATIGVGLPCLLHLTTTMHLLHVIIYEAWLQAAAGHDSRSIIRDIVRQRTCHMYRILPCSASGTVVVLQ